MEGVGGSRYKLRSVDSALRFKEKYALLSTFEEVPYHSPPYPNHVVSYGNDPCDRACFCGDPRVVGPCRTLDSLCTHPGETSGPPMETPMAYAAPNELIRNEEPSYSAREKVLMKMEGLFEKISPEASS